MPVVLLHRAGVVILLDVPGAHCIQADMNTAWWHIMKMQMLVFADKHIFLT